MKPHRKTPKTAMLMLTLLTATLAVAAEAQLPTPDTRLVQINLLAAAKSGASDLSDLPPNTRKAIDDIKDFLPFKSYRILDTSLVRAMVVETPGRPARTFMKGPEDMQLQISMRMTAEKDGKEVFVHNFEISPSLRDRLFAVTPDSTRPAEPGAPAVAPRADLVDAGAFISTSFTAEVGKTVVVGSSRLNGGDEALIVLFTALP